MEIPFFIPIAHAITNILDRSPNDTNVKQGRRLIKTLSRQNHHAFSASSTSLSNYLQTSDWIEHSDSDEEEQSQDFTHMMDEEIICMMLECLFRHGVPRSRFKGSASTRSIATETDIADEFDFSASSSSLDIQPAQDMALLWDDLPLSLEYGSSPIIPAQYDYYSKLLKDHNVDEYFLDDEGEWTQEGKGSWSWRAFEPLVHLDFDEDEHGTRAGSDLDEFPSDSSQNLFSTPPRSLPHPDITDVHYLQIGAETVDPDRDTNYKTESQDYGAEFIVPPRTHNTPEYTHHLAHRTSSSNPTSGQEQPPITRHQHRLSESDLDMDFHFDSDPNSGILHDFDDDIPEIVSGLPSADEIHSGDDEFVNRLAGTVDTDMEALW